MKIALYGLIMISLCIFGYVGYRQILPVLISNENTPLATFILGEWAIDDSTPPSITNVQFTAEKQLEFDAMSSDDGDHEADIHYQFISPNTIQVKGGRRFLLDESWKLRKIDEKLEICFYQQPICRTFSRKIAWQWMLVSFVMIVLAIFFLKKIERKSLPDIHPT